MKVFSQIADDQEVQGLIQQKDYPTAEQLLKARLEKTPNSADAHYLLAVTYYFQGKLAQSIQCLKKSLEIDPRHTDAAICLSVLYNDIGRYDDAKKIFDVANQSVSHRRSADESDIDKKFSLKHFELGDLYFRYRRYDDAIEEYSKAAILSPSTLEIRIRRAKAFAKKGFVTRAIQELQQLKVERGDYLPARIQLGLLYYSQGNILDAELEWESVLQIEPKHREALSYLDLAKQSRIQPKGI